MNTKTPSRARIVIIGASDNPSRYSYKAINALSNKDYQVFGLGKRDGMIGDHRIITDNPIIKQVHTITMYIREEHQKDMYGYILGLKPKRIIFNPGAENAELNKLARDKGILTENACTLVMLSTGVF